MQDIDAVPDLGRALDDSYGDGPPHRPIESVLRTGRRVRRRRQALQGSAAVAAAAAVLFSAATAVDFHGDDEVQVIAQPSATLSPAPSSRSTPTPSPTPSASARPEVVFGSGERLRARPPAVIVIQTADAELGPRFAGRDDKTAAAEVRWHDKRWYVLAREIDGGPAEYFPEAATRSTPTLADFLAEAKKRYGDGTGLR